MTPIAEAIRVTTRSGLPREVAVGLRTAPVTIAYLGASVTAQQHGYRARLHAALCSALGQPHRSINAGIGGIGSISGAFLADDLVVAHRPALCFVEFTTGDAGDAARPELVAPGVEAIVLKLRRIGCAACLLHLPRADAAAAYRDALDRQEQVAERHGIPSIDLSGVDAAGLLRDVVHTTEPGSQEIAEAIARAVIDLEPASPLPVTAAPSDTPLLDAGVEEARTSDVEPAGEAREGRFRLSIPYVEITPGQAFVRPLAGELWGLLLVVGPRSGVVRAGNGESFEDVVTFDEHCHYERISTVLLRTPLPAGATIRIEPSDVAVDREHVRRPLPADTPPGTVLKLVGYLVRPC